MDVRPNSDRARLLRRLRFILIRDAVVLIGGFILICLLVGAMCFPDHDWMTGTLMSACGIFFVTGISFITGIMVLGVFLGNVSPFVLTDLYDVLTGGIEEFKPSPRTPMANALAESSWAGFGGKVILGLVTFLGFIISVAGLHTHLMDIFDEYKCRRERSLRVRDYVVRDLSSSVHA